MTECRCSSGKDRGKRGEVEEVLPTRNKVIVDGVNIAKRSHQSQAGSTMQAGIIDKDMPLDASTVAIMCATVRPDSGRLQDRRPGSQGPRLSQVRR